MEHHLLFKTKAPPASSPFSRAVTASDHFALSQTLGSCSMFAMGRMMWKGQAKMRTLCAIHNLSAGDLEMRELGGE
jgi:hypothetical protein